MDGEKVALIGCGVVFLVFALSVVAVVVFIMHVSKEVEGAGLSVESPLDVAVGETFVLTVVVENQRAGEALEVGDIDISEEYLGGFSVLSVEPKPKEEQHVPIDNSQSYTFGIEVPSGETREFKFKLRAEREGVFRGDVDLCEGMRFKTVVAQTAVKGKGGGAGE